MCANAFRDLQPRSSLSFGSKPDSVKYRQCRVCWTALLLQSTRVQSPKGVSSHRLKVSSADVFANVEPAKVEYLTLALTCRFAGVPVAGGSAIEAVSMGL